MYQGLRVIGGLLVVLGLVFPVGVGIVATQFEQSARASDQASRDIVAAAAAKFKAQGVPAREVDLSSPSGEAFASWMETYDRAASQTQRPFRYVVYLYYLAIGVIDLAVIGLGFGLRAIADMAEKLARVSYKKPA